MIGRLAGLLLGYAGAMALAWLPATAMQEVHKVSPEQPASVLYCLAPELGFYVPCRDLGQGFGEA